MPAALAPTVFSPHTPIGLISLLHPSLEAKARKHLFSVVYLPSLVVVGQRIQPEMSTVLRCDFTPTRGTLVSFLKLPWMIVSNNF